MCVPVHDDDFRCSCCGHIVDRFACNDSCLSASGAWSGQQHVAVAQEAVWEQHLEDSLRQTVEYLSVSQQPCDSSVSTALPFHQPPTRPPKVSVALALYVRTSSVVSMTSRLGSPVCSAPSSRWTPQKRFALLAVYRHSHSCTCTLMQSINCL